MKTRSAVAFVLVAIFVVSSVAVLTPRTVYAPKPPILIPPVLSPKSCETIGGTWAAKTRTCTISSSDVTSSFSIPRKFTLEITGALTIGSGATIANYGTIDSAAIILNHGIINNQLGGTIVSNTGSITNYADSSINNYGTITLGTEFSTGSILNEGVVNNYLGGAVNISSGGIYNYGHGTINNIGGTITNNSGGKIYNYGSFNNSGTINNCGTINNYDDFDNVVVIKIKFIKFFKGTLNNPGTFVNRGTGDFYNEEDAIVNNSEQLPAHFISCGSFLDEGTWSGVGVRKVSSCPTGYDGQEPCIPCTCPENMPDYCPCTECGPAPPPPPK